jgi:hypothetical protein
MVPELRTGTLRAAARRGAAAALLLALLPGAGAQSFLYVCKVGDHTLTGQVPPQECKNVDVRELNPDGTLHRLIPAPLTPEQRRQRDQEEEARMAKEEAERAQAHKDRSLLETYSSVEEIEAARQRAVAGRQTLIDRADARIAQYQKERSRLDEEAEFYVSRQMPVKLKEAYKTNQALTEQQQKTRADALAEIGRINEKFDADRKRFEEIVHKSQEDMEARRRAEQEARER